ncbi:MAG: hypothetical protein AB2669_08100 [Candidatus Thiodiazotropha endolucinida]|nr:hypothetical protein [Candidatus Thiodiazotropha taylori]MCW4250165.1 hypothetical protein [Candidatus Thiodiazotropha endolucinida]MCG7883550.1 hypothetical protein [Candidatus Thiodiazotropha taylori]MCG8058715.1 hypothetical protein [Candidatus Thiodiazotropha taylori]MCG8104606.1 hypothetical protein [Candidatus Thiodiazotropha taylori]
MCVLNMSLVDTRPGANADDPFCPPEGFKGTGDDYLELCRERFATDIMFGQRMLVISRYAAKPLTEVVNPLQIKGPYAKQAQYIIAALQRKPAEVQASAA